ncbi:hypothetical protein [Deinococcus ruber]|uniref:Uncharacterized protein n=1 Tax=Deinococcus ruber TaxID=1848197 RepID=A0A918KX27_9DEIO|nr:hypothetical protein [Deinococcus ruber]GGR38170.1 hypothetical protein GCM10008957_54220 [Deinococcus ruber]
MVRRRRIWRAGLVLASLAVPLLMVGGGQWVKHMNEVDQQLAVRYLMHAGALRINHTQHAAANGWQASAICGTSEQPLSLRDTAHFQPGNASTLEQAAGNLERRLGPSGEDGPLEHDLTMAVRHWPTGKIWVDYASGILVGMSSSRHDACVLVTTIPLTETDPTWLNGVPDV